MAASISEQARAALYTALYDQITAVGKRVDRAREDSYSDRESKSINIKFEDENTRIFGQNADNNELAVAVEIYVRPGDNENWESVADAIAVEAHAKVMGLAFYPTNPGWPQGVARVRKTGATPKSEAGDRTPGLLTLKYAVQFLTSAYALDKTPNQP